MFNLNTLKYIKNILVSVFVFTVFESFIVSIQMFITGNDYIIVFTPLLYVLASLNFVLAFLLFDENHNDIRVHLSKKEDGWGRCSTLIMGKFRVLLYPEEKTGWNIGNFQNKIIYMAFEIGELRWYLQ